MIKKGNIPQHKLKSEHQVEICRQIAMYAPVKAIINTIKDAYGITISPSTICFYQKAKSWQSTIEKLRTEYLSGIMEVPITHKRVRLERYEALFHKAEANNHINTAKGVLMAAQDEVEGKHPISITMNKIEFLSDEELKERRVKILEQIKELEYKAEDAELVSNVGGQDAL